jgi:Uma2 family endonuclease
VPAGFWVGPPDLAVEVLSPGDRRAEIRAKADEYLAAGTRLVIIIDPDEKSVTIVRRLAAPVTLHVDDELDLDDVVPGFRCAVPQIFE